jgi:hypothetical protein
VTESFFFAGGGKIRSPLLALAALLLLAVAGDRFLASQSSDPRGGTAICRANAVVPSAATDREFMAENEIVMKRMMAAMAISPTGDVDRDFVAMMVAHHRGAIEMAIAELQHGHNEPLRRMAQEIIVTQGQEIQAMRNAQPAAYSTSGRQGPTGQAAETFDSKLFLTVSVTEGVR